MQIRITLIVEKIANGYVIEHEESGTKRHANYDFGIAREIEQLVNDARAAAELAPATPESDIHAG